MDNLQSTMIELATTIGQFLPMIEILRSNQNEYTQCCIAHNRKSNDSLIQMSLVSCLFMKSIHSGLSNDDSESDLSDKLDDYIRFLKNSLN